MNVIMMPVRRRADRAIAVSPRMPLFAFGPALIIGRFAGVSESTSKKSRHCRLMVRLRRAAEIRAKPAMIASWSQTERKVRRWPCFLDIPFGEPSAVGARPVTMSPLWRRLFNGKSQSKQQYYRELQEPSSSGKVAVHRDESLASATTYCRHLPFGQ